MFSLRKIAVLILVVVLLMASLTGWLVWYYSGVRLAKAEYYILSLASESSLNAAETVANEVVNGGGGGYIFNDGEFRITASAYKTAGDAETVKNRMSERFLSAAVIDAGIEKSKIKRINSKSDKEIKRILQYPAELFDYILEENLKLDSFERTESASLLLLSAKTETLADNKKALGELLRDYPASSALNKAYNFYDVMSQDWDKVTLPATTDGTLTHRLKYFSCKYIYLYKDFRKNIQNNK